MDAYAEVFEPLRARIHAVALRLTGANHADDVVMDTFLRAWQGLPAFNGRASLSTWLCRIARNCALDQLRRASVRRAESLDRDDASDRYDQVADTSAPSPAEQAERAELRSEVQAALAQLPEAHRQTIELRYMDDLRYAEIAAAMGTSIGTVMSRIFHGHAKLRRLLHTNETDAPQGRDRPS